MDWPIQDDEIALQPQVVMEPFERWAPDFVGPFNWKSNQKGYILVATYYMTKWVVAVAFSNETEEVNIEFMFELFVTIAIYNKKNIVHSMQLSP